MPEDLKKLFQITEAARACSLSRSTLLRLEEKGLLTPAYTAPDSGRRYYDNHNVARILQIEKLKAMGLGTEDIAAYFASGGETAVLLAALEEHLHEGARGGEELRPRAGTGRRPGGQGGGPPVRMRSSSLPRFSRSRSRLRFMWISEGALGSTASRALSAHERSRALRPK